MRRLRKEYGKEVEMLVAQTTKNIERGAKSSVPTRYSGIKSMIQSKVEKLHGEVWVQKHYAPYVEFGTGGLVNVPGELKDFAMQFKGKGIRRINKKAEPYFYPHYFIQRDKYYEQLERGFDKLNR